MGPIIDNKIKQPVQNPQQKRGTGFTNLGRILGAQTGSKVGSAVAGGISNVAQQSRQGTESAKQEFQQKAQGSRVASSQQGQEKGQGIVSRFGVQAQPATTEPTAQPTQQNVAPQNQQQRKEASLGTVIGPAQYQGDFQDFTDEEIADYQKLVSGQYSGPRDLANQEALLAKAQQAETLGGLTQSSGGREELLRQFVGGGQGYTSGMSKLDQLILGKQGNLTGARRDTRGQMRNVSEAAQQAQGLASQISAEEQAAADLIKGNVSGIGSTISGDIGKRFESAQKFEENRGKIANELQNFKGNSDQLGDYLFNKGLIGSEELKQIKAVDQANKYAAGLADHEHGLKDKNAYTESYYKSKLNDFITKGTQASSGLSEAGVTTAEQAARLQALQKLGAGQFQQYLGDDINKVGSFQQGKVGISGNDFNKYSENLAEQLWKAEQNRIKDQMGKAEFARKEIPSGYDLYGKPKYDGITNYSTIDSGRKDIYADYLNQLRGDAWKLNGAPDLATLNKLISSGRADTKKQLEANLKRLQEQGYDVNDERYFDFYNK
jgi:hypothetical protein